MKNQKPTCKICDQGELKKKKKYRMSGPVVVIGYIIAIPSALGILMGLLMMFSMGSATIEVSESNKANVQQKLRETQVPEFVIEKVVSYQDLSASDVSQLTTDQQRVVENAELSYNAETIGTGLGAGIGFGFSLFVMVASLVSGLLGWLLIMKKKILECTACNAVVSAS